MTVFRWVFIALCLSLVVYVRIDLMDVTIPHVSTMMNGIMPHKQSSHNQTSIYFVHIPKTGGTTIGNILNRILLRKNLTFPMFSGLFPWPGSDPLKSIINLNHLESGSKFDILHRHTMYNTSVLDLLFAKDRLVKVTMLRNPLDLLKSLFNFADLAVFFNISTPAGLLDPVRTFLQNISLYERPHLGRAPGEVNFSWTHNFAASFFSEELSRHGNRGPVSSKSRAANMVEFMEQELDLVMIHEHFDASLLFLQELAGLSLSDLLYLDVRKSLYPYKHRRYEEPLVSNYQVWNYMDVHMHAYFKSKLEDKIKVAGTLFARKLQYFKEINFKVKEFCNSILNVLFQFKRNAITKQEFIKLVTSRSYRVDSCAFTQTFTFNGTECITLAIDPNILELAIFCQRYASYDYSKCQGRNKLFTAESDLKINRVIPVELFGRHSGFGWPLLWGRIPVV